MPYKDPIKAKECKRRWEDRNRDVVNSRKRMARSQKDAQLRSRAKHLRRQYGLTLADYESMLDAQNGVCAICHRPPTTQVLHIDHNHTTGQLRKLLCMRCNQALGLLDESPDRLRQAAEYLEGFRG